MGRVSEGVIHLALAARQRPDDALLRFDHGVALAMLGNFGDARGEADVALELANRQALGDLIPQIESFIARLEATAKQLAASGDDTPP
jgi:hypothetical protein